MHSVNGLGLVVKNLELVQVSTTVATSSGVAPPISRPARSVASVRLRLRLSSLMV